MSFDKNTNQQFKAFTRRFNDRQAVLTVPVKLLYEIIDETIMSITGISRSDLSDGEQSCARENDVFHPIVVVRTTLHGHLTSMFSDINVIADKIRYLWEANLFEDAKRELHELKNLSDFEFMSVWSNLGSYLHDHTRESFDAATCVWNRYHHFSTSQWTRVA